MENEIQPLEMSGDENQSYLENQWKDFTYYATGHSSKLIKQNILI